MLLSSKREIIQAVKVSKPGLHSQFWVKLFFGRLPKKEHQKGNHSNFCTSAIPLRFCRRRLNSMMSIDFLEQTE